MNIKVLIIKTLMIFIGYLPLSLVRALGRFMGVCAYWFKTRLRKVTEKNIDLCFSEFSSNQKLNLVRASLKSTFAMLEICAVWTRGRQWRDEHIQHVHNIELFDQAESSSTGTIYLIPHLGNWEIAGMYIGDRTSGAAIYKEPKIKELDYFMRQSRGSEKNNIVPATARGVSAVLKSLNNGEATVLLPDQVPKSQGVRESEFFGVNALTMTLVQKLILRANPRVIMLCALRCDGGFEVYFDQPDPNIYSEDANVSLLAMNASIEKLVKLAPEQYQWEYKRFKGQLDGTDYYDLSVR